uniref:Uncharacterized protein n=1 Tax=Arion vulgaris TaxID=1028688 RepID=A0A0B6YUB1_9EUPU
MGWRDTANLIKVNGKRQICYVKIITRWKQIIQVTRKMMHITSSIEKTKSTSSYTA